MIKHGRWSDKIERRLLQKKGLEKIQLQDKIVRSKKNTIIMLVKENEND
jgi:hypothetical protein